MDGSQRSDGNSCIWSHGEVKTSSGPLCHCSKPTMVLKSWTDENPGRRFYRCSVHGFFRWADEEKPNGWQKIRLVEVRDLIREQKEEIKSLKETIRTINNQGRFQIGTSNLNLEEEKIKLENEVMVSNEKEKLLRQFIVISWTGFVVVTALILTMGKKN